MTGPKSGSGDQTLDYTLVAVETTCPICDEPARGTRFAFARDADLTGRIVHFSCAASIVNR